MNKNLIVPNMNKFAMFVLSHGRPKYKKTFECLCKSGYTGNIVFIVDDQDESVDGYIHEYGFENVYVFNKEEYARRTDSMNNFNDRKAAVFARNACWDIAKDLGYDYFCVMDDDTLSFAHKTKEKERISKKFDDVCKYFVTFLVNTPCLSVSFAQGGDFIGGYNPEVRNYKRKCMNSWFCMTNRPFKYYGTMNDDLNGCIVNGIRGGVFLTIYSYMLHQPLTQQNNGGVSDAYSKYGTYVKSFYSVMLAPSFVKIRLMGCKDYRLHHKIDYKKSYPCIIREINKK